uniref:Telomere repeat-binding protein 5-like n=1 Tax=Ananas comosus var. bracteatus TaxID=296719 RepID=A0A6V7QSY5_ANACO
MVFQKRSDHGSCSYRAPTMLHFPQSAKGKRSARKKCDDKNCWKTIDRERGSSSSANLTNQPNLTVSKDDIKQERFDELKPLIAESFDQVGKELAVNRDDDENSSGCRSIINSKAFNRRMRKILASKSRKVATDQLRDREISNTDVDSKPVFYKKRMFYTRQRTQRSTFKKRKLFKNCSILPSHANGCIKIEESDLLETSHGAKGATSSSMTPQIPSFESKDDHVKLSIKSFKVPELFIEIPETATVGSLKRTVMEAVTAFLGGGLSVGVLLEGKKIRDDNRTLKQAGIAHSGLNNLGFTLEPNSAPDPVELTVQEDANFLDSSDVTEPLARILPDECPLDNEASDPNSQPLFTSTPNCTESDRDSIHSPADYPSPDSDKNSNSRAIVPVPPVNVEALAVVPLRKSRRSELAQRRIRRPFSVAEVEALVQAVEKLGTGRWRDVKLRAFDNAKHRTYVDLKDKWKTLVHTARISPQRRRGEPVPQELLDRVLAAQAYWAQQQAKLQSKSASGPPQLTAQSLAEEDI